MSGWLSTHLQVNNFNPAGVASVTFGFLGFHVQSLTEQNPSFDFQQTLKSRLSLNQQLPVELNDACFFTKACPFFLLLLSFFLYQH